MVIGDETEWRVLRDEWGKLWLETAGGERREVSAVRMFPISDPEHWISLLDTSGKELHCIHSLNDLNQASRSVLEQELAARDFFPVIEQVLHVSSLSEPCEWTVVTDRGPTRFVLKSEEDVRRLGPHQAYIVDSHGIRYMIRDSRKLDAKSRRHVEWYL